MESYLNENIHLIDLLSNAKDYKFFNSKYEELFIKIDKANCNGIIEKIKDVHSIRKFLAMMAELRVGAQFIDVGCEVEFIPDGKYEGASPDLEIKIAGENYFIEVFARNEYTLAIELIPRLRQFLKNRPYRVDFDAKGEKYALPGFTRDSVAGIQNTAEQLMEKFKHQFRDTGSTYTIDIDDAHFTVTLISRSDGYPGVMMSDAYFDPTEDKENIMSDVIIDKASKVLNFNKYFKGHPYMLAINDSSGFLDSEEYNSILYGTTCHIGEFPQRPDIRQMMYDKEIDAIYQTQEWVRILRARDLGWGELLHKTALLPTDYGYITKYGLYLTSPILTNVSGVFVFHNEKDHYLLPNPFAEGSADFVKCALYSHMVNMT